MTSYFATKPLCFLPNWAHELGFQKTSRGEFSETWSLAGSVSVSYRWMPTNSGGVSVEETWFVLGCGIEGRLSAMACKAIHALKESNK